MSSTPFGDLGPCNLEYDGDDMGDNQSVNFRYSEDAAEHKTAQYGTNAKDRIFTGTRCEVETILSETTLAIFAAIMPNGTVDGDQLMVANGVGQSMRENAAKLVLKPIINGVETVDETKWITIFKAAAVIDWDVVFDAETDRGYRVTFYAFPCVAADELDSGEDYEEGDLFAIGYQQVA